MTTVLLTDPDQCAALAAARALAAIGHRVISVGQSPGLAGWSRAVVRHVRAAASEGEKVLSYVETIRRTARAHFEDVIIPISDAARRS